jgi:flagellar protein FliT
MDNQEILDIYEAVAVITDQMLVAARTGNWDQLVALESRCSSHVQIIKQNAAPREALSPIAHERKTKIIKKILQDDREIRNITEPWMAQLSAMINSTGAERKLSQAYGAHNTG